MHNFITPIQQNLLNNLDTSLIFYEDLESINIFDYSKSTVLVLDSFYGLFDDDSFYSKIELAEYIIFKKFIPLSHNDYDKFIADNPLFENLPFLVSKELLLCSYLFNKISILFRTLNSQINELAKSKINKYFDCNTLLSNTTKYYDYFKSCNTFNDDLNDIHYINTLIFTFQINSISIANTVKKIIEMFNLLYDNFSGGNKPIMFLFLMSNYIIKNQIVVQNKNNYKDKFISLVVNYSSTNAIKIYEHINKEFSNLECAALFVKSDFILHEIQKNMNYQSVCECENINVNQYFETNILLNLKEINE